LLAIICGVELCFLNKSQTKSLHHACDRYVGYQRSDQQSPGRGLIWLTNVVCSNSTCNTDLSKCSHSAWGVHNCTHDQDVYIVCSNTEGTDTPMPKNPRFFEKSLWVFVF